MERIVMSKTVQLKGLKLLKETIATVSLDNNPTYRQKLIELIEEIEKAISIAKQQQQTERNKSK